LESLYKACSLFYAVALFPETCNMFLDDLRKQTLKFNPTVFLKHKPGSRLSFYVGHIHSRTMYLSPIEIAWKDPSIPYQTLKIVQNQFTAF